MRGCAGCGQRLPRALPGAGRPHMYCTPACRQRAYPQRARRARQEAAGQASEHDQGA